MVIIAGSETTATTLAAVLFYLTKDPKAYQKLQREIDISVSSGDWTYDKIKSISFIDDIINEALRLKPALLSGGYRLTPAEGIVVDGQHIPGNTTVFVPTQLIQTDERYWPHASEFLPERFGERRKELKTDSAPFLPFTLGKFKPETQSL